MPTNHSNAIHTQWRDLIENLNATTDDRGNPFFQKTVSRIESLWEERVTNQKDKASAALLSALAQSLTIYSTTRISHESIRPTTAGGTPCLSKPVRVPRRRSAIAR